LLVTNLPLLPRLQPPVADRVQKYQMDVFVNHCAERAEILVGASGFEPEASCAQGRRATRLRYAPTEACFYSSLLCELVTTAAVGNILACVESWGWGIAIVVFSLPRNIGVNAVWEDDGSRVSNDPVASTGDSTPWFGEPR
jgi:hypothetical protein